MIHPLSDVKSKMIGSSSNIWQFVVVLERAHIGENCNICSHCFIENDVRIGDGVTIKNCVQIWDGIEIESNVFIGPNVTFTNDRFPVSRAKHYKLEKTLVKKGAVIGANATILPGITLGEGSMIAAGSVVTKNVEPNTLVAGNPARFVKVLERN
jgi:UDP-2-acetamido-3-amino-2,3-dideoxy-glucuronate N-acetyltransferase